MKVSRTLYKARDILDVNFFRYAFIGGFSAAIDLAFFIFLYNALSIDPLIATTISTIVGITNSFFMNAYMNFKKHDKLFKRYLLFFLVGLAGLLLSTVIIYVLHNLLSYNANIAKVISIPLVVVLQFFLNKRFSFSDDPDKDIANFKKWLKGRHR